MDAVEVRKLTPDERRNHILDIALEAFLRDGYAGTSMSRIAALLGGSKTTLYNYFSTKKELFVAVTDRESGELFDKIFTVGEAAGDFRATVVEFARRVLTALLSEKIIAWYRLIAAESGRFPEVGHTAHEVALRGGVLRLTAYFQHAIEAGEMRNANPRLAAEQFLDLTAGNLHKLRLWSVVTEVDAEAIADEAGRIANTFIAAFGNDVLSRAARQADGI
jgi:TetR/AcrR family transcriptional regulator, mexJK operon transcriptional repressor